MPNQGQPTPFERSLLRKKALKDPRSHHFIGQHSAQELLKRIELIQKQFQSVLLFGREPHLLSEHFKALQNKPRQTICTLGQTDLSTGHNTISLVADEEYLPFQHRHFDLIVWNMTMHWVNKVPDVLQDLSNMLTPEGVLLCSFLGGETLIELRQSFLLADHDGPLGVASRFCEFLDVSCVTELAERIGFYDIVLDREKLEVIYPDVRALLQDLKHMQETNITHARPKGLTTQGAFERMQKIYLEKFQTTQRELKATFELFYLIGWKK